jgi:hypothetical protein
MTRFVRPSDLCIFGHAIDHRDGAGHLGPEHEAELRAHVRDGLARANDRPFVRGPSSTDASAEQSGEDFIWSVTTSEARRPAQ